MKKILVLVFCASLGCVTAKIQAPTEPQLVKINITPTQDQFSRSHLSSHVSFTKIKGIGTQGQYQISIANGYRNEQGILCYLGPISIEIPNQQKCEVNDNNLDQIHELYYHKGTNTLVVIEHSLSATLHQIDLDDCHTTGPQYIGSIHVEVQGDRFVDHPVCADGQCYSGAVYQILDTAEVIKLEKESQELK